MCNYVIIILPLQNEYHIDFNYVLSAMFEDVKKGTVENKKNKLSTQNIDRDFQDNKLKHETYFNHLN